MFVDDMHWRNNAEENKFEYQKRATTYSLVTAKSKREEGMEWCQQYEQHYHQYEQENDHQKIIELIKLLQIAEAEKNFQLQSNNNSQTEKGKALPLNASSKEENYSESEWCESKDTRICNLSNQNLHINKDVRNAIYKLREIRAEIDLEFSETGIDSQISSLLSALRQLSQKLEEIELTPSR